MLIRTKGQPSMNYTTYYTFGIVLIILKFTKKEKDLVIREKKLKPYMKKPIKKYQISHLHMKRILMLYTPVENLRSAIYQTLLIRQLLLIHTLVMKKKNNLLEDSFKGCII